MGRASGPRCAVAALVTMPLRLLLSALADGRGDDDAAVIREFNIPRNPPMLLLGAKAFLGIVGRDNSARAASSGENGVPP